MFICQNNRWAISMPRHKQTAAKTLTGQRPVAGWSPDRWRGSTLKRSGLFLGLDADDEPMVMVAVGLPSRDESHLPDHYRGLGNRPRIRREASEIVRRI